MEEFQHLKSLIIDIQDEYVYKKFKKDANVTEESNDICPCDEKGIHYFIFDKFRGDRVCCNCGIVDIHKIFVDRNKKNYPDKESVDDFDLLPLVRQAKQIRYSDLMKTERPLNMKRILLRDNYYDAKERKDNGVLLKLREIANLCHIDQSIAFNAFNHYQKLNKMNVFRNLPKEVYCTTLMHMSAIEQGCPIRISHMLEMIKDVDEIDISDINKVKYKIVQSGYNMKNYVMGINEVMKSIFKSLRSEGINEVLIESIEEEANTIKEKCYDTIRFLGNTTSYAPSIIFLAYKKMKKRIPNFMELLEKYSFLSENTIITKYRKLKKMLI